MKNALLVYAVVVTAAFGWQQFSVYDLRKACADLQEAKREKESITTELMGLRMYEEFFNREMKKRGIYGTKQANLELADCIDGALLEMEKRGEIKL